LEAFGRRPPNTRPRHSCGRHPKPFTQPRSFAAGHWTAIFAKNCCDLSTVARTTWVTPNNLASPCSHSANPELQKPIDGNRAGAGRNKIKQHQGVHHFRLVKPIVDTICRVNRLIARNHCWRVRQEGDRTNDQKAKGGQRREKSERDTQAAKEFNSRNEPLQYADVWDAKAPQRLYKCLMSFLVRELVNSGQDEERPKRKAHRRDRGRCSSNSVKQDVSHGQMPLRFDDLDNRFPAASVPSITVSCPNLPYETMMKDGERLIFA
jgi:hypothetical protein